MEIFLIKKISEDSLDLIQSPSPSVKIQIIGGKGVKAKHCWTLSTNFWIQQFVVNAQQCFAFTPRTIFPAHNLNFHWRWRWWDQIQATFQNLFYFNFFTSLKVHPSHLYRSQNQARQQRKFGYLELWIQISQSGNWNIL